VARFTLMMQNPLVCRIEREASKDSRNSKVKTCVNRCCRGKNVVVKYFDI
jgi:hypothetical protein